MTAPLSGYVVVDLSTGIAGAYCTKLLADGGAEVVKVEAPEGDPLRRWSASGAPLPADHDGALFAFLSSTKQSVTADPDDPEDLARVRVLLESADAVVWSNGSRVATCPALTPDAIRAALPHLTVTTITPFGLEGPWRDRAATEFTLQAWSGGIVGLGRGSPDRAPVFVGGQIGEWLTGVQAAIGTLVSRRVRSSTGRASSSTCRCSRRSCCASPTTRSPTSTWWAGPSGAAGPSSRPGWRPRATAWWGWASARASSGSTSA